MTRRAAAAPRRTAVVDDMMISSLLWTTIWRYATSTRQTHLQTAVFI
ncbi:hypothetical protein [Nocardia sp. NBC_01009]|nr:hypothetical protein OHA42_08520 [Nocardia sp. NBC_01009]